MSETDNSQGNAALLSLLGSMLGGQSNESPKPDEQKPSGDLLSGLLSNPEIISKLPQIMSMVKPLLDGMGTQAAPASLISSPASVAPSGHTKNPDNRSALLCAMKPYLSSDRQQAIDYMMKLSRLGDILKTL